MRIFYIPDISGDIITLPEEESKHAYRTLRLQKGDTLSLTDGNGRMAQGVIAGHEGKHTLVRIVSIQEKYGRRDFSLHVAIAPTKNMERTEWFLEKATEIGIDRITFLMCDRSERKNVNTERCQKILASAMKQSIKAYIPLLEDLCSFREFVKRPHQEKKFIAYCETDREEHLNKLFSKGDNLLILIGPEGDFSPAEAAFAAENGFIHASLGRSRLRTETAGISVCLMASLKNEAS